MKNINLNKLEIINSKYNNNHFIKSYPILNELPISPAKIKLLELIYSYQSNGQQFNMSYANISNILKIKVSTIGTYINNLKEAGYITTTTIYNAQKRGSLTIINLNVDSIISEIENIIKQYDDQLTTTTNNQPAPKNEMVETPAKPANEEPKQENQLQPEYEAVEQPIQAPEEPTQDRFDALFPEDEDDNEHISIKSVNRVINDSEDAEEKEALKYVEDYEKEMNSISEDEQYLIDLINNEDGGVFFDLSVLSVDEIIEHYNDNLNDNLKNSTILLNVVDQLINKDIITKVTGEDFSTYLILTSEKKQLEKVAEMEKELV
ncbi:helix-turn-helix domain-containing protein [Zunongwangia atlantica]|uniref:Helix-turn-helix domain-containing protein n=1 Tax=Zunongwangia atlantica 22II14-10F7 TaxID=1185767 RepID=A0A1Y1T313_9FLAO|nr:helix-turn-helix domain-containing protein [Zunongwangia atlantica]ORL45406.1 hypothetical protein IIF7_11308 [Zunongwangia atlantica 22II14-10F7]